MAVPAMMKLPKTDDEWNELLERVLDYAEEVLGRPVSRKDSDKEVLKHDIAAWVAIERALNDADC